MNVTSTFVDALQETITVVPTAPTSQEIISAHAVKGTRLALTGRVEVSGFNCGPFLLAEHASGFML